MDFTKCTIEGCHATVKNHRWGRTKATGWFFTRDGEKAYCPEHVPEWVEAWRARKERES